KQSDPETASAWTSTIPIHTNEYAGRTWRGPTTTRGRCSGSTSAPSKPRNRWTRGNTGAPFQSRRIDPSCRGRDRLSPGRRRLHLRVVADAFEHRQRRVRHRREPASDLDDGDRVTIVPHDADRHSVRSDGRRGRRAQEEIRAGGRYHL